MSTVSNASPLIALAAIGQLQLLPGLFGSITIPPAVAAEIAPSISERPNWFVEQALAQPEPARIKSSGLGRGEGNRRFFMAPKLYEHILELAREK